MSKKIRVGIVGVGNCASALVQGVDYYKDHEEDKIPGIMFPLIGGYHPSDIEFVSAFDVDRSKVGRPLREAIFAAPNCARIFNNEVPDNIKVSKGPVLDGVSDYMLEQERRMGFRISSDDEDDVVKILKETNTEILLNYLPVGSEKATEFYAEAAIKAGVSFINCIPVLTLNSPEWESKFIEAEIPYIGSDMKSQFGASVLSQMLQELAFTRGMLVDYHQQINIGGNTDFNNMMVQKRLKHKKTSKENVIRAQNEINNIPIPEDSLFAGPSTFIPYLKDNKVAYFNLNLRGFGDAPVNVDIKLSVQDSENSAGVVIDAIRFLKVAKEMKIMGCLRGPSAFTQKTPPISLHYEDSLNECKLLADRKYSHLTERQTTKEGALQLSKEDFESGRMKYLDLIKD